MKTRCALLSTVLTIALTLPVFGHPNLDDTTKTDMKKHGMRDMLGKPTVDATVEGLHMKVWLMAQVQHKEVMMHGEKEGAMGQMETEGMKDTSMRMGKDTKELKHDGMGMNKAVMDSMMAGTHHIRLDVTDAVTGKEVPNAGAKVLIVSPSKKNSSVDLKHRMSHFGGALTLDEKGEYRFTVNVTVGGVSKTTQFQYAVK